MYAEFSYDIVPGTTPNDDVLRQILSRLESKPNGTPRLRCDLLSDTLICEIVNAQDYESTNRRLTRLRTELAEQFSYTFSLRRKGDPIRIKGTHDESLARQIIDG